MPQRGLRVGSREVFVPRRGLCAGDLQIIDDSQNSPRQRFRSPSLSSRDRQPSPRADAASNIHRARTWLSSFLGVKPAIMPKPCQRARETAGRPAEDTTANIKFDDALGSRKRGHEMVCDMPVMQQGRQMQLAEVHVGCNS